jgi:hypothetical protein
MIMNSFTKLLLQKFLDWQKREDKRRTVAQFAEYIGLGQKTVSHALNGTRPPSRKTVDCLFLNIHFIISKMEQVLAILTPDILTLIAYAAGAGVFGTMIIIGVLFASDMWGWLP